MNSTTLIEKSDESRPLALSAPTSGINIFDSGAFESIARIAGMMAQSPLVPETLRTVKVNGKLEELSQEKITANCFLVIEQAARWKISPFAALGCASVIYGRLMWEGKLVAGVLDALLGVKLGYEFTGAGDKMSVLVSGTLAGEDKPRTITGTVAAWKTSQWADGTYEQRMAYRGAREWARRHAPAVLMGVVTDDETPTATMRDVTSQGRVIPAEMQVDPFQGTTLETLANEEQPAPAPAEAKPAQSAPTEAPMPSNPATIPATGRQKKDRIQRDVKFHSLSQKDANGKTLYIVGTLITGKMVEFTTFSESLAESLRELDKGTPIRITVVQNADSKTFSLEDYAIIKEEGTLV